MAFNRSFLKTPLTPEEKEAKAAKRKIKANKQVQDGIQFDSTIELYMYNLLKDNNIRFDMKKTYILQEGFTYRHETIRPMTLTPDYILLDYPIIIDTKGFANERSPLQYKMLKYQFHQQGLSIDIRMPNTQKKCREVVYGILNGFTLPEPLTEHAGTIRKNKLKRSGFVWDNGIWYKGLGYQANFLMSLEHYDFEEFLLNHK